MIEKIEKDTKTKRVMSCTRLRIRLSTISGKPGFNLLKTPLNHGAEQASNDNSETNITA